MADLSSFINTINNIIKGINENVVNPAQSGVSEVFGTPEPDSEVSYIPEEDISYPQQQAQEYLVDQVESTDLEQPELKKTERIDALSKLPDLKSSIFNILSPSQNVENPVANTSNITPIDIENNFDNTQNRIQNQSEDRKLDPRIEKNPRYQEMIEGVSDTGGRIQKDAEPILPDNTVQNINNSFNGFFDSIKNGIDTLGDPHFMDNIFMGDGILNLGNLPILKQTDREKFEAQERENYRNSNPITEGALVYRVDGRDVPVTNLNSQGVGVPVTSEEWKQKYRDYWNSNGGIADNYSVASDSLPGLLGSIALNSAALDTGETAGNNLLKSYSDLGSTLDKMSNENYDDGTLRWDSVKSSKISGKEYKRQEEAGFPGRPYEDIDNDATYDKLTEMREFGYIPYIEDQDQAFNWGLLQGAEDVSKFFNLFGNVRDREYQPSFTYGNQTILKDEFENQIPKYINNSDRGRRWTVTNPQTGDLETFIDSSETIDPQVDKNTGSIFIEFPQAGKRYYFNSVDDLANWANKDSGSVQIEDDVPIGTLSYKQSDGSDVSLSYDDIRNISQLTKDGSNIDWGPNNLAKDASDRKDFLEMLLTRDFSDLAPSTVDLLTGSAPLFIKQTAWPMSLSNAVVASEGLDPQIYDPHNLTYGRLSDNMTGDKYIANIGLNAAVPATEHIAGAIGGGKGIIGTPIQNILAKHGAPAIARYLTDIFGEGAEEVVAGLWEDAQTQGLSNWYANKVYETDDNGKVIMDEDPVTGELKPRVKADTTGHEVRDPNTPLQDRIGNMVEPAIENALAGSWLGLLMGGPKAGMDKISKSGYYDPRELDRMFEERSRKNMVRAEDIINLTPEDFGTYGKERKE